MLNKLVYTLLAEALILICPVWSTIDGTKSSLYLPEDPQLDLNIENFNQSIYGENFSLFSIFAMVERRFVHFNAHMRS